MKPAPDLMFLAQAAQAVPYAASPLISIRLRIEESSGCAIHSIVLRCQLQIETTRRRYTEGEQEQLQDLFGGPERWGQTLRPMLWANISASVPAFTGSTTIDLPVPCSFDFNIAASKYF